ncbi:MAG: nucleotidyltransferase domain-containing protein [Candidatus Scalinduaceae bacterium]
MCNKELKEKIIEYFQDKKGVIAVYLYGSIVTGKNVMDSDVDIALLTEPYKDSVQSQRAKVCYQVEISRLIRRDVDLVFLQEAGELLSFQILSRGQVIVETDKAIHRSFRAFRLIKCLDFQFLEDRMKRGMIAAMKGDIIG